MSHKNLDTLLLTVETDKHFVPMASELFDEAYLQDSSRRLERSPQSKFMNKVGQFLATATSDEHLVWRNLLDDIKKEEGATVIGNAFLHTEDGISIFANMKTVAQIKIYFKILKLTPADFHNILTMAKDPSYKHLIYEEIMLWGAYYRMLFEMNKQKECINPSEAVMVNQAVTAFKDFDSFLVGKNFIERLWNNIEREKRRGRRPVELLAVKKLS